MDKAENNQKPREIYIYGDIISDHARACETPKEESGRGARYLCSPGEIVDALEECGGLPLNIYIHSAGGSVFSGLAIYNVLKRYRGSKTVYVDGLAASIASVIAFAGDRVIVPENAFLMIHKPWAEGGGNAKELRKLADDLDAVEEAIFGVYTGHLTAGTDGKKIRKMMDAETWLSGREAASYFAIELTEAREYAARIGGTLDRYRNIPESIGAINGESSPQAAGVQATGLQPANRQFAEAKIRLAIRAETQEETYDNHRNESATA